MAELTKLSSIGAIRLPNAIFQRLGGSQDAQSVTWVCAECGTVKPTRYANGYVRARCECQRRAAEEAQAQQQRDEMARRKMEAKRASCARCYTWLGEDLTALQEKTFAGYKRALSPVAYDRLREFATTVDENGKPTVSGVNWLLFGPPGTGKTHLAAAVCNELQANLFPCRFMTGQGLFDAISRSISMHQDSNALIDAAVNASILVIDDIDKVHIPERLRDSEENFQVKTFFKILNRRYLKKAPVIITTNALDITPYVGKPSFSRLKENGRFIEMTGADYRDSMIQW